MNTQGTFGDSVTVALPNMGAREMYRLLPNIPKEARPFARNMIELIENDVKNGPVWGDHPLQQPRHFFAKQMELLERAMRVSQPDPQ